jgi:hypothetical protein
VLHHWFSPFGGSKRGLTNAQRVAFAVSEPGAFSPVSLMG